MRRSTTRALIKLTDEWFKASESSNNFFRILFLDFSKAFDLINNNVSLQIFLNYNFPHHQVIGFFTGSRTICFYWQQKFNSTQGTIAGPNDFELLINDLLFYINSAKYVDDLIMLSISTDLIDCSLQSVTDRSCSWSVKNGMHINEKKTKEVLIHFGTNTDKISVPGITTNG